VPTSVSNETPTFFCAATMPHKKRETTKEMEWKTTTLTRFSTVVKI
jgi:hypothetical protein